MVVVVVFIPDGLWVPLMMALATGSASKMEGMVSKRPRRGTRLCREGEGRAAAAMSTSAIEARS
jgi:hypothetical protein